MNGVKIALLIGHLFWVIQTYFAVGLRETKRLEVFNALDYTHDVRYLENLRIGNGQAGIFFRHIPPSGVFFSAEAEGKSKTVVQIEDLAGGTVAVVMYFDGKSWHRYEEQPVGDYNHFSVIAQRMDKHSVTLTYAGDTGTPNTGFHYYVCIFTVDSMTNVRSDERRTEVSEQGYDQIFERLKRNGVKIER